MFEILVYVFFAFAYYCICFKFGKLKEIKPHIFFAVLGFVFEARAIYLMNARYEMYQPYIPKWLLISHISLSLLFLLAALSLIVSGVLLYLRRNCDIRRDTHKGCIWFFFIMWFFATASGLLILY